MFASLDCGREATTDRLVDLSSVIGDSHAVPDRKKEWAHKPCLRLPRPSPSGSWTQSERYVNSGMREELKHEQCIHCELVWVWPTACAETCWCDILPRQTTGYSILYRQCMGHHIHDDAVLRRYMTSQTIRGSRSEPHAYPRNFTFDAAHDRDYFHISTRFIASSAHAAS